MMHKKWVDIPGYEGLYQINKYGEAKRLLSKGCLKERVLKFGYSRNYARVTLSKDAIKKQILVHIIVGRLFVPNPKKLPLVCHKDDNGRNPRWDNLFWGTQSDNIKDCHRKGRASNNLPKLYGINNPMFGKHMKYEAKKKMSDAKKVISDEQISRATDMVKSGDTVTNSAISNGISVSYLSMLINGVKSRL